MNLCDYTKPLMALSVGYLLYSLFMAVGTAMMTGNTANQFAANQAALKEAWKKARSRTWQAPIYALTFPVLLVGILPIAFPFIAALAGIVTLLLSGSADC